MFSFAWKMVLAACPTLCSALMDGCKGMVHARCCHWLIISAAFTAKAAVWPTVQSCRDGHPMDLLWYERSTITEYKLNWTELSSLFNHKSHAIDRDITEFNMNVNYFQTYLTEKLDYFADQQKIYQSVDRQLRTTASDHNFWTRNLSRSFKLSKDSDCSLISNKTSDKYYHLTVWVQGQVMWAKVAWKLITSFTIKPQPPKKLFRVQTRRLAKSFELLSGPIALTGPKKFLHKATCNPAVFAWTTGIILDAKVLKTPFIHYFNKK